MLGTVVWGLGTDGSVIRTAATVEQNDPFAPDDWSDASGTCPGTLNPS
eukprot:gene4058-4400_t